MNSARPKRRSGKIRKLKRVPVIGKLLGALVGREPVVPVLRLSGVIGQAGMFRKSGLTFDTLEKIIEKAFETPNAVAIAVVVNSPGGSPVQSALIANHIRRLSEEKKLPVYAFCEDAAASGGYWLACSGDEIYAMPSSIVGSVGVIYAAFGFSDAISRIGVERRIYTAGESKSRLDPFKPANPDDIAHIRTLQADIHEEFKGWVRTRRGDRLGEDTEKLFSGDFWSGSKAVELGLVDGIGDYRSICKERFGENVIFRKMERSRSLFQRLTGGGVESIVERSVLGLSEAMETRAWWARIGL